MKEEISFAEKAKMVADQYDKWNFPLVLLADKYETPYVMIENLYEMLSMHEVEDGESHNQWYARITAERYPHYIKKMGGKTNAKETKEEREARLKRYEEHKEKFYKK